MLGEAMASAHVQDLKESSSSDKTEETPGKQQKDTASSEPALLPDVGSFDSPRRANYDPAAALSTDHQKKGM